MHVRFAVGRMEKLWRTRPGRRRTGGRLAVPSLAARLPVVAVAVLAGRVAAQSSSRPQLLIIQAEADLAAETLLIEGQCFVWANDNQAVVTLAGNPLTVWCLAVGAGSQPSRPAPKSLQRRCWLGVGEQP